MYNKRVDIKSNSTQKKGETMNQILITQKLYVTPELKKKKKMYKTNFFISIFLVCVLFSYYIYAEYDRNKNEEVSREILSRMDAVQEEEEGEDILTIEDGASVKIKDNIVVVVLNNKAEVNQEVDVTSMAREDNEQNQQEVKPLTYTSSNGKTYDVDCVLNIPSLGINYPVLKEYNEANLKVSLNKFWGCNPNEVGNYVIAGHNYKNKKMFGKLSQIKVGEICEITDLQGTTLQYKIYDKYVVEPDNTYCTSQLTDGKKEITLITCTNYGKQRLIVKAREV